MSCHAEPACRWHFQCVFRLIRSILIPFILIFPAYFSCLFHALSRSLSDWHIKYPVPLIEKSRVLYPGGRFPPSFIYQVIIITGLNKKYITVCSRPEDGPRCRLGIKLPLKLKTPPSRPPCVFFKIRKRNCILSRNCIDIQRFLHIYGSKFQ